MMINMLKWVGGMKKIGYLGEDVRVNGKDI